MKWILFLLSASLFANEGMKELFLKQNLKCGGFTNKHGEDLFISYKKNTKSVVKKILGDTLEEVMFYPPYRRNYRDSVKVGDRLYVLGEEALDRFDYQTGEFLGSFKSHLLDRKPKIREQGRSLAYYNGLIYIAHGRQGVVVFDIEKEKIVEVFKNGNDQFESEVNDLLIYEDKLLILNDSFHFYKKAFRGIAVYDLIKKKEIKKIKGIQAGAKHMDIFRGHLIITNRPMMMAYKLRDVFLKYNDKLSRGQRVYEYDRIPKGSSAKGKSLFFDNDIYMCFGRWEGGAYAIHRTLIRNKKEFRWTLP